ncbi:hypothetical protein GCM10010363_66830 [Streptomyces omiyaensis]|nr:BON domain-containing protein [Streptomyces omiyaensis]GGY76400.1 hypothetical protein GCM10010363_66830 [Streptomyces omiyaensis]
MRDPARQRRPGAPARRASATLDAAGLEGVRIIASGSLDLGLHPSDVTVEVEDGRVTLSGTVRRPGLVPVLLRPCNSIDGVVGVVDRLRRDDRTSSTGK